MSTTDVADDPVAGETDDEVVEDQPTAEPEGAEPPAPMDEPRDDPSSTGVSGLVFAPGLPENSRARLLADAGDGLLEITEDPDRIGDARLVVLSTRVPRAELAAHMALLRQTGGGRPVVALAHAGGEALSVEVVRRGGVTVVAEGNEAAIAALLTGEAPIGAGLLESYDRHVTRSDTNTQGTRGRDPVTGLPDATSLDVRLANLEQEGQVPRLAYLRIVRAPMVPEELGEDAAALVRRRLAAQFLDAVQAHHASIFTVGAWDFALVGVTLSPESLERLGQDLDGIAETYSPAGVSTLGVAIGHAGAEVSTDIASLRESAQRALDVAVGDRTTVVVGADSLALGVSASTELEAALQVAKHVEKQLGLSPGAFARTGEIAATVATALGYDGMARSRLQLAAHLYAVGMAALPAEALGSPDQLTGEALAAHRDYPVRSAEYLVTSAGPEVADSVRGHRERWDGTGFPQGLADSSIPISSRIVATAIVLGELLEDPRTGSLPPDALATELRTRAGTELDPDMVAVTCDVIEDVIGAALLLAV